MENRWGSHGPLLLPFGSEVQARKRFKTGFDAQWQSRSISAMYLGPAPSTPGGHLVLVEDDGAKKVLLTNTIYPVRGVEYGEERKPKFRISGKRSRFVVKVVAAADVYPNDHSCGVSSCECAPGGESSSSVFSSLVPGSRVVLPVPSCEVSSEEEEVQESGFVSEGFRCEGIRDEKAEATFGIKEVQVGSDEVSAWIESLVESGEWSAEECEEVLDKGLGRLKVATRPLISRRG